MDKRRTFLTSTVVEQPHRQHRQQCEEVSTTSALCRHGNITNVQDNRFVGLVVLTGDDDTDETEKKRSSCSSIASSIRTSTEEHCSVSTMEAGKLQTHDYGDDEVFQTFPSETNRRRKTIGNRPSVRDSRDSYLCWSPSLRTITAGHQRLWSRSQFSATRGLEVLSPPHIGQHDIVKVRLKRKIGSGGFGSVYLGVFRDRFVAVKKLHRCVKNALARAESFRAECNVARLRHPNIVRVLAASSGYVDHRLHQQHRCDRDWSPAGVTGIAGGGDCLVNDAVIVMEYAGQRNLLNIIDDRSQQIDVRRRVRFAIDIAQALNYLHKALVVHLDLKPANVIVAANDTCKLGDFGCCQVLDGDTGRVSPTQRSSLLTGTFAYRAPELLKGEPPGVKADVYSFGVTLWHMEARRLPYAGQDPHAMVFGVVAYNIRPNTYSRQSPAAGDASGIVGRSRQSPCLDDMDGNSGRLVGDVGKSSEVNDPSLRYRRLYSRCWNADCNVRPNTDELVDVLTSWM